MQESEAEFPNAPSLKSNQLLPMRIRQTTIGRISILQDASPLSPRDIKERATKKILRREAFRKDKMGATYREIAVETVLDSTTVPSERRDVRRLNDLLITPTRCKTFLRRSFTIRARARREHERAGGPGPISASSNYRHLRERRERRPSGPLFFPSSFSVAAVAAGDAAAAAAPAAAPRPILS